MATFRKRGNWWSYRIDMGRDPVTNKRLQPTISDSVEFPNGFRTKKEAQTAATAHQNELDNGTYVKVKDISFVDFSEIWFNSYDKKKSTRKVRRYELLRLTRYFKFDKLKDITKEKYQGFINYMHKSKKYAYATRIGTHNCASMMFEYAVKFDYIKVDPTTYAEVTKDQKTVEDIENKIEIPQYLEKDELSLYLKTAIEFGEDDDYFIFLTLSYSGMRDGELCALKKSDFIRSTHEVSITKTYFSDYGRITEFELLPPKTDGSIRKTELDPIVFDALDAHLAKQNEYKMLNRKTYFDQGFVFANTKEYPGYPLSVQNINTRMNRILKLAKLNENLTPHSLRHTHVSLCAEAGIPLEDIMDRLGHEDDKTTRLVYMHVTKTRKKTAAKKFGDFMRNE